MARTGGSERRARFVRDAPVRLPLLLLGFALLYGTGGYVVLGFAPLDAVYMTIITMTTVGYEEIEPLGPGGRAFTMTVIAVGFTAVFVLIAVLTTHLASGEMGRHLARRSMRRRIDDLSDHFVVCAFGRVGRAAVTELAQHGADVVVVEVDPALESELIDAGVPYVLDEPTKEGVLERAGLLRARGLLCAVDSDAINVYITLSARAMKPDLFIIGRASSPESVATLRRAGADRVVPPYTISGVRMAALALQPAVLEFVDMLSVAPDLRVEELVVQRDSTLVDQTVRQACSTLDGVMVLAVRHPNGDVLVPPRADTALSADDVLIVLGPVAGLEKLATAASA